MSAQNTNDTYAATRLPIPLKKEIKDFCATDDRIFSQVLAKVVELGWPIYKRKYAKKKAA